MKRIVLFLLSVSVLFSCDQLKNMVDGQDGDGAEKGKVTFPDGSSLTLDDSGHGTLRISATHAWTSNIDWQGSGEGWISMNPTSAKEGGDYDIQFAASSQPEPGRTRGVEVVFRIADHKFRANVFQNSTQSSEIYISSVTLSRTGTLNLKVNEHVEVYASYEPSNANVIDLRWDKPDGTDAFDIVTNDPRQATIHGKRPGRATMTVVAKTASGNYNGPSATLDVVVTE